VLDVDVMMKEGKVKRGISVQRLWDWRPLDVNQEMCFWMFKLIILYKID
jgi:hypothetical protein